MFERFTERARAVVVFAQDEARTLRYNYIGTEHLLLGLLREEDGLAARALEAFGVTLEEVRGQVARIIGQGEEVTTGQIPFTPRAKKVLELALREAISIGHNHIGTEHVLLGLARENEGVAMRILLDFDLDAEGIRQDVLRLLSGPPVERERTSHYVPTSPPVAPEVIEKLEELRRQMKKALETRDFENAAQLKGRGQRLRRAARELERAMSDEQPIVEARPLAAPPFVPSGRQKFPLRRMPRRVASYGQLGLDPGQTLFGWLLFAVALGIGHTGRLADLGLSV
jgi:ATP-dependent Clp protease ATP-binding subunit ClpA